MIARSYVDIGRNYGRFVWRPWWKPLISNPSEDNSHEAALLLKHEKKIGAHKTGPTAR